ncbi:MAG: L-seryl-tRNA(Sec) selenium transferase [Chloroflexota bacterium]|nr:L-seryl-tRNA(Sec) selenium transferase [Chloroflexota bacterium]MDE2942010.1 L-seryl-tRNA(Sec) selenium transferase [Chloroflexota bacterium]MDE3267108.1 L-seryl-tRNA(Sec) selenium transferase [Chloroflexota bacterium]
MSTGYRRIPSVDRLLSDARLRALAVEASHDTVAALARERLEDARRGVADGVPPPPLDELVYDVCAQASRLLAASPSAVINATGVVLHTNLGRAPLSDAAAEAVARVATSYSDLELDLYDGTRGSRQAHVSSVLRRLTGAEAALVVNNNASAVLLALSAIAHGREVVVSRGEAVEIGGGFRIPDVLNRSGAVLREVGTTNRTYAADYEDAICAETGALLKVHSSNFVITGFTHEATVDELVEMGARHGVPVIHDLGSGCLLDTARFGLAHEPMVQQSVTASVDLACFSGDKLLGGPQAGIIVGKREAVSLLAAHPLARAMRIDKLSLAALTATLVHYLKGEAVEAIPVWRMMAAPLDGLEAAARRLQEAAGGIGSVERGLSTVGGGSLPGETLPTWLLTVDAGDAQALAARLRAGEPPVVARIEDDRVVIDPRTVLPGQEEPLARALRAAAG